jgi:3-oxoacyl-[acyl-carrier protein] reductase
MDLGLTNRVALVTGAGGGLGSEIAVGLAREGAEVIGLDIDQTALGATRDRFASLGHRFTPVTADLGDPVAVGEAVAAALANHGPISILVNNTGGPPPGPIFGLEPQRWHDHFRSMVASVIHLTDLVIPGMKAQRWGRIITSTSSGVVAPIPNLGVSNALRSSLVGWSKTLAGELGGHGITANVLVPGRIATARIVSLDRARADREGTTPDQVAAASVATIPVGRYGLPEEYAAVAAFLASQPASFVNGSVVRVDGGMIPSV